MGSAYNPASTSGGVSLQENDTTRTTRTGTTFTTHNTYTGLSTTAATVYRITIFADCSSQKAQVRLTFGDGVNTDVSKTLTMVHTSVAATNIRFIIHVRQLDTSTTGSASISTQGGAYSTGSQRTYEDFEVLALTNVTAFANITQILLEANNNTAGQTADINQVIIEKLV